MQSETQCAEATADDHLRNLIQLMKRGGRISITDIPNDPTFLSSHFGGETVLAMADRLEAALSAAEPVRIRNDEAGYVEFLNQDVPYIVRDIQGAVAILMDLETRNVIGYRVYDPDGVYARRMFTPAPSVAVKDLEWETDTLTHTKDDGAEFPSSHYWTAKHHVPGLLLGWEISRFVDERFPKVTRSFVLRSGKNEKEFATLEEAKAAAQADYETRIRSALSAQVQDVEVAGFLVHDKDNPEGRFYKRKPSISQDDMSEHEIWIAPLYTKLSLRDVASIRSQAVEEVLSALTAHELYQYRPRAFQGFIDYARSELISAQVQDVAELDEKAEAYAMSISDEDRYEADVKQAFIAGYKSALPAAPAKQEGGTNE